MKRHYLNGVHFVPGTRSMYTVAQSIEGWQIQKDGRFFCVAESEGIARSLCESLNRAKTPLRNYLATEVAKLETQASLSRQSRWS